MPKTNKPRKELVEQLPLVAIDNPNDVDALWGGMPELHQEDLTPWHTLNVRFANAEDMVAFEKFIGQTVTPQTKTIWYPKVVKRITRDKHYVDGDE